jgi:hypothetical protein
LFKASKTGRAAQVDKIPDVWAKSIQVHHLPAAGLVNDEVPSSATSRFASRDGCPLPPGDPTFSERRVHPDVEQRGADTHPDVHGGLSPAESVEVGEAYLIAR